MFFILSKVFYFFIKPLNWVILAGLIAVFSKRESRRRRFAKVSVGMLIFFTNPLIINFLEKKYEAAPVSPDDLPGTFDVGVVLGGFTESFVQTPPGVSVFNRSGNRISETVALFHSGKIRTILIAGGWGRLVEKGVPEALSARDFLLRCGVPDSCILLDDRSRNTHENALFSKNLLEKRAPGGRLLLITSAFHMPRAEACFRKTGLSPTAYPTDFYADDFSGNPLRYLEPRLIEMQKWELLIKEWIGLAVYRMKGFA